MAYKGDVFEDTEQDDKEKQFLRRFSHVSAISTDLPNDFDDEEIDEDEAFDEDDLKKWGDIGSYKRKRDDSDESGGSDEDDPSNEDDDAIYSNLSDLLGDDEEQPAKHDSLLKKIQSGERPKKKFRSERTETAEEGEFNIAGQTKLTLSDLMSGVSEKGEYSGLRKQMSRLQKTQPKVQEEKPVHKAQKDRGLRLVQYDDTTKHVSEWDETVQQMKKTPHLSFPLNPDLGDFPSLVGLSDFPADTPLERRIEGILKGNGLKTDLKDDDDPFQRQISKKEMIARTQELAKMRHLIYYQEQKMQWHSRIKSKKYRRILRKQKEKNKLTFEEMKELDPDAAKLEVVKKDKERALERMTLKHKTTGKWAKQAAKHNNNPALKQALHDHHQIGIDLRKKMEHADGDSGSESDSGESVDEDSSLSDEELPKTGVFAMKFMQRGLDAEKARYQELKAQYDEDDEAKLKKLDQFIASKRAKENDEDDDGDKNDFRIEEEEDVTEVTGRKSFTGKKGLANPSFQEVPKKIDEDEQPKSKKNSKQQEIALKESKTEEKKPEKKSPNQQSKKVLEEDEEPEPSKLNTNIDFSFQGGGADDEEDDEHHQFNLVGKANAKQREMIMRAFANDDVEAQFFEAKKDIVEGDLPKDETKPTLPGWGDWAGEGIVAKVQRPNLRKQEELEKKRANALKNRKDAHLKNVIISQTVDKKAVKYQLSVVPRGMPSAEVYDASIRNPIGKEWNSVQAHKELIKPKVLIHQKGSIIEPLEKKLKPEQKRTPIGGKVDKRQKDKNNKKK